MKRLGMVFAVAGLLAGCGSDGSGRTENASCDVAPTDVVGFQDCRVTMPDGHACVAMCGRLPGDGGVGTLLGVGCEVQIGTSTPRIGECVAACSDCKR